MKIEDDLLNGLKEMLINGLAGEIIIMDLLAAIPELYKAKPRKKVDYLMYLLDSEFNKELYILERRILYHKKKSELFVYLFQYYDLLDELPLLCENEKSLYDSMERGFYALRRNSSVKDLENDDISKTNQFLINILATRLIEYLKQFKKRVNSLLKKYDIDIKIKYSDRIRMINSYKENEKIYLENFELLAAAIAFHYENNKIKKQNFETPSNQDIFSYCQECFWINNKAKKGKQLQTKTMISYYSDRNGANYNKENFEKYLKAFRSAFKSIN